MKYGKLLCSVLIIRKSNDMNMTTAHVMKSFSSIFPPSYCQVKLDQPKIIIHFNPPFKTKLI